LPTGTATDSDIYTLSLHDALPIYEQVEVAQKLYGIFKTLCSVTGVTTAAVETSFLHKAGVDEDAILNQVQDSDTQSFVKLLLKEDRKSTRLNSSHVKISYAVFCLK